MANIKRYLHINLVFFLATLLFQTNSAVAQKTSAFQGPIFIPVAEAHLPIGLPKLIEELTENFPFEIPYLSKRLDISFVMINGSAQMSYYKTNGVVNLADGTRIEKFSRYINKRMDSIEADFRVNGSCVTHRAITELLGELTLVSLPSSPFNFTNPGDRSDFIYAKKIEHGIVTIAFAEKNLCLTRVEFHSPPGKHELKKLEEADMRTPEEIQKKPAPKP